MNILQYKIKIKLEEEAPQLQKKNTNVQRSLEDLILPDTKKAIRDFPGGAVDNNLPGIAGDMG